MKFVDRLCDRILLNPAAWFLFALFILAEYWNYEKGAKLDTVCEAITIPDVLPSNPETALEKAQVICDDHRDVSDLLED
jgi:hypothetical protein